MENLDIEALEAGWAQNLNLTRVYFWNTFFSLSLYVFTTSDKSDFLNPFLSFAHSISQIG